MSVRTFILPFILTGMLSGCGGGGSAGVGDGAEITPDPCDSYIVGTSSYEDFVCAHNSVRESVIPAAVPVLENLVWNADLAIVAQAYAETCTFAHNPDRSDQYNTLTSENIVVGENLFVTTDPAVTPYDSVNAWAAEDQFYDYATNTCATGEVCGHYTQIVWRDTLKVGCGMQLCGTVAGTTFTNATIMVCNYATAGNVIGQLPY